jgi:hypothetical protein
VAARRSADLLIGLPATRSPPHQRAFSFSTPKEIMQIDGNTTISLRLSLDKVNTVLGALSSQPYQQVAGLITDIQQQATAQLQAPAVNPVPVPEAVSTPQVGTAED